MKVFRLFHGFPLFLALLCAGGLFGFTPGFADPDDVRSNEVLAAAQSWLADIDAGKYEQSYNEGCLALRNKVPKDQWLTVMKAVRAPLGALVSRKEISHSYKPDGFEGLEGECMVISFNTSFSKLDSDLEVVVLKREDGIWRGAGYNAQPQTPNSDSQDAPQIQQQTTQDQQSK